MENSIQSILLVEDDPIQTKLLKLILGDAGFLISHASTVADAIAQLSQESEKTTPFSLILTDVHLSDGTSFELCRILKSNKNLKNIPVVLITGNLDPTNVLLGLEAGVSGFISKDRSPEHIIKLVKRGMNINQEENASSAEKFNKVEFLGNQYELHVNSHQLLNVLSSAFEDVAYLNQERLKTQKGLQKINHALKKEITDRKQAQKALAEQQNVLIYSSKMSALGEMAGGIAHEINNPLSVIRVNLELLRMTIEEPTSKPEDMLGVIEVIDTTVIRISKLIQGLRSFCRDGRDDPFTQVPVQSLIEETTALCSEKLKSMGIELTTAPFSSNLMIDCRLPELAQVLLNLLNNSCDALSQSSQKWIRIEVQETESTIQISVIDNGPGVPFEISDKIFQPFFTTKQIGSGTGLGLSIASGIIEAHHGTLRMSTKSGNTCFIITLPKTQNKESEIANGGAL